MIKKIKEVYRRLFKKSEEQIAKENQALTDFEYEMEVTDEDTKRYKKLKFRNALKIYLKRAFLYFMIFLFTIGTIRNLFYRRENVNQNITKSTATQTFIKNYAEAYYTFPQTEESKALLTKFQHKKDAWKIEVQKQVRKMEVVKTEIQNVVEKNEEIATYYLVSYVKVTKEDEDKKLIDSTQVIYYNLDLAIEKQTNNYLVISNNKPGKIEINSIVNAARFNAKEPEKTKDTAPTQIEKINDSLNVFFDTYSKDSKQAVILTNNLTLPILDKGTVLKLDKVSKVVEDNDNYYIKAEVLDTTANIITKRKYFITLDKNTPKIKELKEE